MFVDLDHFKAINDSHGHAVGDVVLQEAALRMNGCVRESDSVGRLGGDEFVVLLQDVGGPDNAMAIAEKMRCSLGEKIVVEGKSLSISASIGIAIYPQHGNEASELANNADAAMYNAKKKGRNRVELFQPGMTHKG